MRVGIHWKREGDRRALGLGPASTLPEVCLACVCVSCVGVVFVWCICMACARVCMCDVCMCGVCAPMCRWVSAYAHICMQK